MTPETEFGAYCALIGAAQLGAAGLWIRRLRAELQAPAPAGTAPSMTVVVACKGVPEGLAENLRSLVEQEYDGTLETLLVAPSTADPAWAVMSGLAAGRPGRRLTACAADAAPAACGGKARDLLAALEKHPPRTELLLFADADLRVAPDWARRMAAPLDDPRVGAASTCAVYLPARRSVTGLLKTLWLALYHPVLEMFPQVVGHSFALRARDFAAWDVRGVWSRALFEDASLTRLIRARAAIRMVWAAMPVSVETAPPRETLALFLKWMTGCRIHYPGTWWSLLAALAFKTAVLAWILNPPVSWGLLFLYLGVEGATAWLHMESRRRLFPAAFAAAPAYRDLPLAAALASPLLHPLHVIVAVGTALSGRRIRWGGRDYRLAADGTVEANRGCRGSC